MRNSSETKNIVAVITLDKELTLDSGASTFLVKDKKEQEVLASELGRILSGNVNQLANGVIIITEA